MCRRRLICIERKCSTARRTGKNFATGMSMIGPSKIRFVPVFKNCISIFDSKFQACHVPCMGYALQLRTESECWSES